MSTVKPRFMFPPHPGKNMKMLASDLDAYEKQGGWLAQRKFNGSHAVCHLHRGLLTMWNRQFQPFTYYKMTEEMVACLNSLNIDPEVEYIFDGELMHTKAKYTNTGVQAITDTVILYDLLFMGEALLHDDYGTRYAKLAGLCKSPTTLEPKGRALQATNVEKSNVWLAELFTDEFTDRFYEMYAWTDASKTHDLYPEIEGLVLKREKDSYIDHGGRPYDVNWMMRCRKEKKKTYQF